MSVVLTEYDFVFRPRQDWKEIDAVNAVSTELLSDLP